MKYLLFLFCFFIANRSIAQNQELNQQKYWQFRSLLTSQFMKVGNCLGCSIPAETLETVEVTEAGHRKTVQKLNFGADSPALLGWYMGVLATEYHLLKQEDKSTLQTEKELYFALIAFDRLDAQAEMIAEYRENLKCYDKSTDFFQHPVKWDTQNDQWLPASAESVWADSANNLNGYFMRMDGSPAFISYFTEIDIVNAGLTRPKYKNQNAWANYEFNPQNIENSTAGYRKGNNESSQDQVFNLLMGLMLTAEFAQGAHYNNVNLAEKAILTGKRILSNYTKNFQIKNPVTGKTVCIGGNSSAFSPSLSKMVKYFNSDGKDKNNANTQMYLKAPFTSVCAANGEVNRSLYAIITALSNTTSNAAMCKFVTRQGYHWGFYYLLRKALYPHHSKTNCDYTFAEAMEDLNACPTDGAFWNGEYFQKYPAKWTNWTFSNRYLHQCTPTYARPNQQFNNLDYMLLYNLTRIVFSQDFENLYKDSF